MNVVNNGIVGTMYLIKKTGLTIIEANTPTVSVPTGIRRQHMHNIMSFLFFLATIHIRHIK
jgi:hypothetical protein